MLTLLALCSTLARAEDTTATPAPAPAPTTEPAPTPAPAPAPAPESAPAPAPVPVTEASTSNAALLLLEPEPRFEVGLETGWMGISDERWGLFESAAGRRTVGVRAAYRLKPALAVVASWQAGMNEGHIYGDDTEVYYDEDLGYDVETPAMNGNIYTAFASHEVGLGARYGWEAFGAELYVAGQAQLLLAKVSLDEDMEDDANPGQLDATGTAFGGYGGVGISLPITMSDRLALVPYLELGSSGYREATFDNLGGLVLAGGAGRFGLAARF